MCINPDGIRRRRFRRKINRWYPAIFLLYDHGRFGQLFIPLKADWFTRVRVPLSRFGDSRYRNIGWEVPISFRARISIKHTRHYHTKSHASSIQISLWINCGTARHGRSPSSGEVKRPEPWNASRNNEKPYVDQTRRKFRYPPIWNCKSDC